MLDKKTTFFLVALIVKGVWLSVMEKKNVDSTKGSTLLSFMSEREKQEEEKKKKRRKVTS